MKEEDIRKRGIFNKYLKLVEKDVKGSFSFRSFRKIACPACGKKAFENEFTKNGFKYVSCKDCSTLYVNPRPPFKILERFYSRSPSTAFWVNKFFKPVADARREKIFIPRAEYIAGILKPKKRYLIGDIGAGFGLFLEELRKILPGSDYVAIEPSGEMVDICRKKGLQTRHSCLESISSMDGKFDLLTAFELIEHLCDPAIFLDKAYSLLRPGGYFYLTTLNGKGFDVQLLWERSKSITPPHHLNFFNPKSMCRLLEGIGFKIVEVSTPGKLDWDIVEGMIKKEGVVLDRFWNVLAHESGSKCKAELQSWISRNNLSSHMRILVKRPLA